MITKNQTNAITRVLKGAGCKAWYLFGSHATGKDTKYSDIDIGVEGVDSGRFFSVYSLLEKELDANIDLVDFDAQKDFFDMLKSIGEVKCCYERE